MESEIARPLNGAGAVRQIRRATGYVMGALDIAMTPEIRPRYGFLVYNASMHYWNVSWPLLLRESASRNAVPSMTMVVEALETVDDRDVEWRVRYLIIINLTNAHDDARQTAEAAARVALALEHAPAAFAGNQAAYDAATGALDAAMAALAAYETSLSASLEEEEERFSRWDL